MATRIRFTMALCAAAALAALAQTGLAETHVSVLGESEPLSSLFGVTRESKGAVTIELTPKKHENGQLVVSMKVTTHTVNDLDKYDLKRQTELEFDSKKVHPTSAPKLKGHHNSGQIVFPLNVMPKAFSIKIRGIDEPKLRVFSWP